MTTSADETTTGNTRRWTFILILAALSTLIGSAIPVGYNIGVVNSPADIIKVFCNDSVYSVYNAALNPSQLDVLWSAIVSIFLVGGATGSLGGSWLADKIGRKGALITSSIISATSGIFFAASKSASSVEMLLIGRLLIGLASGLITCVMPMYLTELAPLHLRGATGVICPLGITFGVLMGQVISLREFLGTEDLWPYLLAIYSILVVFGAFAFPFIPESPKYLFIIKKQQNLAIKELVRLRDMAQEDLDDEILELKLEEEQESEENKDSWNILRVIKSKELLLPLLLVCFCQAGQQFSGINAVFYYSVSIFKKAGFSEKNSQLATIGAGVINLGMAIISIYTMSRFKRRMIMQISCFLSAFCLILLGISISLISSISWMPYFSILGVLGYVLCYGLGLGPIPYFIGSELFEVGPRPSAMALGSMANWGGNFVIGMTFPTLQRAIGALSFFIFAGITVILFCFVRFYLPETKGKDPTEIAQLCNRGLASKPFQKRSDLKYIESA